MYSAIAQFAMGKKDYFERATKVIDGVEYPQKGRLVYVGPTVGQPKTGKRAYTKEVKETIARKFLSLFGAIAENEPVRNTAQHNILEEIDSVEDDIKEGKDSSVVLPDTIHRQQPRDASTTVDEEAKELIHAEDGELKPKINQKSLNYFITD